jgi:hypothetical protein
LTIMRARSHLFSNLNRSSRRTFAR